MYLQTKTANQNYVSKTPKSDKNFLLDYLTVEDRTSSVGKQLPTHGA
jgi:hypothetical protein